MKILIGLILLTVAACYSLFDTLWFIVGALLGTANLYFIKNLLYEILVTTEKNLLKIALLTLVKFPLLYGVGFALLYYSDHVSWAFLIGFSVALALGMRQVFHSHDKRAH